jgi:hypothetical protein
MSPAPIDSLDLFFPPHPSRSPHHYSAWRCGGAGAENDTSVGDLIRFEAADHGNEIPIAGELLLDMDRAGLWAIDVVWVCASPQEAVLRYGSESITDDAADYDPSPLSISNFQGDLSEADEIMLGPSALILGIDDDGGYLVLYDASQLDPKLVEQFKASRHLDSFTPDLSTD